MPDVSLSVGLDTSGVSEGSAEFQRVLAQNGIALTSLIAKLSDFNSETGKSKTVFEGFTAAGEKVSGTVRNLKDGFETIKISVSASASELQRFRSANDDVAKAAERQAEAQKKVAQSLENLKIEV